MTKSKTEKLNKNDLKTSHVYSFTTTINDVEHIGVFNGVDFVTLEIAISPRHAMNIKELK